MGSDRGRLRLAVQRLRFSLISVLIGDISLMIT